MKSPKIIFCILCSLTLASGSAFAFDEDDKKKDPAASGNGETSDVVEMDSLTVEEVAVPEKDIKAEETQEQIKPQKSSPRLAEDENNPSISSFNFLYYLIEKFKFPDLLDESF